jgi:adenylosuccinate synthase
MTLDLLAERYKPTLDRARTYAVICNQFGDTGKGKIIDLLIALLKHHISSTGKDGEIINVKCVGGANAGHTANINGEEFVSHLLPTGAIHDRDGVISIIGSGVAFDPYYTKLEIEELLRLGLTCNNLRISLDARLVLPHHKLLDRLDNGSTGKTKIGTTGKGIGPVYTDYTGRLGLTVNDMLNPDIFSSKLRRLCQDKITLPKAVDPEMLKKAMQADDLANGAFYHQDKVLDLDAIVEAYTRFGNYFKDMIHDTDGFVGEQLGKARIVLEGSQGAMLDINVGGHPYVTSSDCSLGGTVKGTGLKIEDVDEALGLVKAFYMTRVGNGPFPSEFGGKRSEEHWKKHTRESEKAEYGNASVNDKDELRQGIKIRTEGNEYGATTGRARRTGWLDLPLLRRAIIKNGRKAVLTKIDVLDECDTIKLCVQHKYVGPTINLGREELRAGTIFDVANTRTEILEHCEPVYKEFPGWRTRTRGIRDYEDLPTNLRKLIGYVEQNTGINARMVSVGPEREETIIR